MDSKITVRPATMDDHALIVANNQAMAMETENRRLEDAIVQAGVRNLLLDSSKGFYLVAEWEGRPVGNLMITREWSDWRNGDMWWFQSVYLKPEGRGKGVFSAMFRTVEDMARAEGVKELRLYVERDNHSAQKVYSKLGMKHSHYDMWEMEL
ncbi:MAG: GNAT family N-acetyltransferase [Bacteroidia bacterium]